MNTLKQAITMTTFVCQIYLKVWMAQQIIVNNLKFSAPVMIWTAESPTKYFSDGPLATKVIYHLPKSFRNFGQNVNGKAILVFPTGKFPKFS